MRIGILYPWGHLRSEGQTRASKRPRRSGPRKTAIATEDTWLGDQSQPAGADMLSRDQDAAALAQTIMQVHGDRVVFGERASAARTAWLETRTPTTSIARALDPVVAVA